MSETYADRMRRLGLPLRTGPSIPDCIYELCKAKEEHARAMQVKLTAIMAVNTASHRLETAREAVSEWQRAQVEDMLSLIEAAP